MGRYLFGDLCSGTIWDVPATATSPATPEVLLQTGLTLTGFGEDAAGELYLEEINGGVYHLVSNTTRVAGDRPLRHVGGGGRPGRLRHRRHGVPRLRGGFPDALSAAPLAGRDHAPLLLVPPALPVPASIATRLAALAPGHITLVGGTGAIPKAVADHLVTTYLGGDASKLTRLGGVDRYDTSAAIADPMRSGKYARGRGWRDHRQRRRPSPMACPARPSPAARAGRCCWSRPNSIPAPVATALAHLQPGCDLDRRRARGGERWGLPAADPRGLLGDAHPGRRPLCHLGEPGGGLRAGHASRRRSSTWPPARASPTACRGRRSWRLGGHGPAAGARDRARAGQHPHGDLRVDAGPRSWSWAGPAAVSDATAAGLGQPCP